MKSMGTRTLVSRKLVLGAAATAALLAGSAPQAVATSDADQVIELGRRLFFDETVSRTGTVACSSCHDPEHGFSDKRVVSMDETGPAPRHSQPVTNLTDRQFHWDGEFPAMSDLLRARLAPSTDAETATRRRVASRAKIAGDAVDRRLLGTRSGMSSGGYPGITPRPPPRTGVVADGAPALNNARHARVSTRLRADGLYDTAFKGAFGDITITERRVMRAMEAYLMSLRTTESPYDAHVAGDTQVLSDSAKRGLELFEGDAGCTACHSLDVDTSETKTAHFRNTGVAKAQKARLQKTQLTEQKAADGNLTVEQIRGMRGFLSRGPIQDEDLGRAGATLMTPDSRKFKVPNLRDVAQHPPYMHDGSLATLTDVIQYYNTGGTKDDLLHGDVKPLGLDDGQVGDLVTFLESLSGYERAGLGPVTDARPGKAALRLLDDEGTPLRDVRVTVDPCGDRLHGTNSMPSQFDVTTDAEGVAHFDFPLSTHVRLVAPGLEIQRGGAIPDTIGSTDVRAVRNDLHAYVELRSKDPEALTQELGLHAGQAVRGTLSFGTAVSSKQTDPEQLYALERVRTLAPGRALYRTVAWPTRKPARVAARIGDKLIGPFEFDPSGGESAAIDLDAPALPKPQGGLVFLSGGDRITIGFNTEGMPDAEALKKLVEEAMRKRAEAAEKQAEDEQKDEPPIEQPVEHGNE